MAGLSPVLGTLGMAISGLSQISGAFDSLDRQTQQDENLKQDRRAQEAQQRLALQQLQQRQENDLANLQENIGLEREKIEADTKAAEDKRHAALRRAMARQNVQFASQGISSSDSGSTQAVLLGLFDESDDDRAERSRIDELRNRALNQDVSARSRLNILQQSQLQEKQRLERALLG